MASEKIDALELDIVSKTSTEALDNLIAKLGELEKALNRIKSKTVSVNIKEVGDASKEAATKADALTNSFMNQAVKITALIAIYKKLYSVISDGVSESMNYIKTLNMFNVSLGQYADSASKYGETVRDAMGIDIAGWQKAQGVFQTLIEGFGVGGEQAAYMSQQLTQLSYDIASYYDLTTEEAQNKIKAAVSGRIEPIRKLGWDISQGKLVDIASNPENYGATTYSINQETGALEANTVALDDNTEHRIVNFNQLTQQEKVQLRYIALMTQVTEVQGNMGKTLHDPANQMKIFKEQMTMTARALGNIFIPAINEVLPYLTAFARLAEEAFSKIATLFGFEIPDMSDRIGIEDEVEYYDDIVEATGRAASNAKKIKDYTIGLDELNVLRPDDGSSGGSGSGTSGEQSNLNGLITPGYDFLSKAIENRVNEAKANLELLAHDFEEHPIQVSWEIFSEGAGTIGEGFWTWVLGKTPEELAQDAWDSGISVGEAFANAFFYKSGENIVKISSDFWGVITGEDTTISQRAAQSGRTIAGQFFGEASKTVLEFINSNEYLKWYYELTTGRNAEEDLVAAYKYLDANKVNTKKVKDGNYTLVGVLGDKSSTTGISKGAEAITKSYAGGILNGIKEVEKAGEAVYNSAWGAADNQGKAAESFFKTSSGMAKRYNEGLKTGVSGARSAGNELYTNGYNGAANYGQAVADYYNVSSGASSNYAKGLVNGVSGAAYAGESLFSSSYNGASNYGNSDVYFYNTSAMASRSFIEGMYSGITGADYAGQRLFASGYNGADYNGYGGQAYFNLADSFARLFSNALGSHSALSDSYNAGYKLANEGTWGAYDLNSEFEYVGDMAGQGYVLGIRKNEYKAEYAGDVVASATLYRMKEVLGIASPSKKTYEMGKFFDEGFANAISDFTSLATDNASNMAELSLKAMRTTQGMFSGFSVPTNNNTGYGVGAMNESAMMNMASTIYQAVASGISTISLNADDRDIKVIIDGKEVFNAVETERRRRGVGVGNNSFGGV